MKAKLSQYQQSPRKVRLVADSIRNLSLDKALQQLEFMPKRSARALHKLLRSAFANTGSDNPADYRIGKLIVDEGPRYRRIKSGFRGSAAPYYLRSSHVTVELTKKGEEEITSKSDKN